MWKYFVVATWKIFTTFMHQKEKVKRVGKNYLSPMKNQDVVIDNSVKDQPDH